MTREDLVIEKRLKRMGKIIDTQDTIYGIQYRIHFLSSPFEVVWMSGVHLKLYKAGKDVSKDDS